MHPKECKISLLPTQNWCLWILGVYFVFFRDVFEFNIGFSIVINSFFFHKLAQSEVCGGATSCRRLKLPTYIFTHDRLSPPFTMVMAAIFQPNLVLLAQRFGHFSFKGDTWVFLDFFDNGGSSLHSLWPFRQQHWSWNLHVFWDFDTTILMKALQASLNQLTCKCPAGRLKDWTTRWVF